MSASDFEKSARQAVAEEMARERGKPDHSTLDVFNTGQEYAADMSVRHLVDGGLDWAKAYASAWKYVNQSKGRFHARWSAAAKAAS